MRWFYVKISIRRLLRKTLKDDRRVADALHNRESLATTGRDSGSDWVPDCEPRANDAWSATAMRGGWSEAKQGRKSTAGIFNQSNAIRESLTIRFVSGRTKKLELVVDG